MTSSNLFGRSIRFTLVLAALTAFTLPSTAQAQRPSLSGIDQKVDDLQNTLGPVPGSGTSDIQQQIDALRRQNEAILSLLCTGNAPLGICSKIVFVTSLDYSGDLASLGSGGGIQNADAECTRLARAAGHPGTYKAWLSDSNGSPSTSFTRSTQSYVLVNAQVVATSWADLTDGTIGATISKDESGVEDPSRQGVWTGTDSDGTAVPGRNCADWASAATTDLGQMGNTTVAGSFAWTRSALNTCEKIRRLFCFQQ